MFYTLINSKKEVILSLEVESSDEKPVVKDGYELVESEKEPIYQVIDDKIYLLDVITYKDVERILQ